MFDLISQLLARLRAVWDSMTLNQKVISGATAVALVVTVAYLSSFRISSTPYTVLFSQLDAKSASEIITRLEAEKISYRLSSDGATIEVPEDRATQLKVTLTADGLPRSGIVGFEILDTTTFTMSERIQDVQIQRALQGELSKALMTLDAVEWADVKLSIPQPTLFTDQEQPATAAVILKLRMSDGLAAKQVEGVARLIASAVPGLDAKNVTILDTQGNSLTKAFSNEAAMVSSTQWEFKMQVDQYLANEAKRMLDGAFGMGKSLVTVNANLDWDKVERTSTTFDQTKSAALSEERETESTPSPDGAGERERTVVNYDTGQIVENFVKNTGDIKRMTVSVFIDRRDSSWTDTEGVAQVTKVPWTGGQLASIRTITENAVGYSEARGDLLEVVQTEFGVTNYVSERGGMAVRAAIVESIRAGMLGLAIIAAMVVFFFTMRSVTAALDPAKISMKAEEEIRKHHGATKEEDDHIPESDRDALVRKIIKTTIENPEIAAKTLKTFFKED